MACHLKPKQAAIEQPREKILTSKLTAIPRENERKWQTPGDKTAQTKNRRAALEAIQATSWLIARSNAIINEVTKRAHNLFV
jgi:hypothetical protein